MIAGVRTPILGVIGCPILGDTCPFDFGFGATRSHLPIFRNKSLVELRGVREARGQAGGLHPTHASEEGGLG
jgi:hypothetical protein